MHYLAYVCYYICCKSCVTLNILTTVISYDGLLRKVKKSLCLQNRVTQNKNKKVKSLKRYNRLEDAVCAP